MRCQSCQTRAATVHYTELLEGGLREFNLCEDCYALKKPHGTDMIGMLAEALAPAVAGTVREEAMAQACANCGLTYAAFRSRGRLGCPLCYESFRPALEPLLEKIHGGRAHVGKSPVDGGGGDRTRERLLISLRRKLQDAIQQENYELAASLRDELRKAEDGGQGAEA
jgi:protein arginine kinase activator